MGEISFLATYRATRDLTGRVPKRVPGRALDGPDTATPPGGRAQREPLLREVYGEVLRDLRQGRGERLSDVANRAAISPQYLSEIERGRKDASSEIIAAVARSLEVPVRTLSSQVTARMSQGGPSSPVCLAA